MSRLQDAIDATEWEIAASAFPEVDASSIPGHPGEEELNTELEMVTGWDGMPLDEAEISHRALYGDNEGDNLIDRPLRLAAEQEFAAELTQRDQIIAQLQQENEELQHRADPELRARQERQREDMVYDMIANPEQTLQYVGSLQQQLSTLQNARAGASMAAAHRDYGRAFEEAHDTLTSLDPNNPTHCAIVQGILASPDPGQALMEWRHDGGGRSLPAPSRQSLPPFMAGARSRMPSINNQGGRGQLAYDDIVRAGDDDHEESEIFASAFR